MEIVMNKRNVVAGDRVQADAANGDRKGTVHSFGYLCGFPAVSIMFDGDKNGTFMQLGYVNVNFKILRVASNRKA
jgi:hypothetical protein